MMNWGHLLFKLFLGIFLFVPDHLLAATASEYWSMEVCGESNYADTVRSCVEIGGSARNESLGVSEGKDWGDRYLNCYRVTCTEPLNTAGAAEDKKLEETASGCTSVIPGDCDETPPASGSGDKGSSHSDTGKGEKGSTSGSDKSKEQQEEQSQASQDDDSTTGGACAQAQQTLLECKEQTADALKCCNSPMSCMGADGITGEGNSGMITGLLSAAGMLAMSGGSLSEQCSMGKNLQLGSAGMNGATAYICNNKKGVCEQVCAQAALELETCGRTADVDVRRAKMNANSCTALTAQVGSMTQQALQGVMNAQMAALCNKEAETQSYGFDDFNPDDVFNNDCSDPANASNPLCQDVCNQPGAQNNPLCHANSADTSIADNNTGTSDYGESSGGDGGYGADLGDGGGGPGAGFNPGAAGGAKAKVVPNNSGGGIPGNSGGGSFAGASNKAGPSYRGKGYNTDILRGTTKGGGYTSSLSNGGSGGGGFKGYGKGGRGKGGKFAQGNTFDLKKYLPGYGKGKNKKGIVMGGNRSLASLKKGIGSKYSNVFKTVRARLQLMCLKREIQDCR